jgi:2-oxoglutarate dehydrogenase E2 component (dihydrolipoamide succinyltransferase)
LKLQLVGNGDYVEKDQAIAEVDSDKATLELPAEASGIITKENDAQ